MSLKTFAVNRLQIDCIHVDDRYLLASEVKSRMRFLSENFHNRLIIDATRLTTLLRSAGQAIHLTIPHPFDVDNGSLLELLASSNSGSVQIKIPTAPTSL